MKVPLLDLVGQYKSIQSEIQAAIAPVMESQMLILGATVEKFEAAMAELTGVKHSIAMSSGSDAILIAAMGLGLGREDDVIVPSFTFFATAGCIARLGIRPVFADIDPKTYCLSPDAVTALIARDYVVKKDGAPPVNRKTGRALRGIMPVHLYGQCADMDAFLKIGEIYGIPIIEDAAQAIDAHYQGRPAGSMGTISCFSFYPTKNLGAFGDAGHVVTPDPKLGDLIRKLRVHGGHQRYYHDIVGINGRMDAIQAAVLSVKIRHLKGWIRARQERAARYAALFAKHGLTGTVTLPFTAPDRDHTWHQYVIRAPRRDALRDHLKAAEVGSEVYYPLPLHMQSCFADLGCREGDLPESEKAAKEVLALPIYPELSEEQQGWVVAKIAEFYGKR
ncbi:MAG: DegT/DnrJ/EryC1/StrS family aminotransferase [Candidatus Brocadiae bacterium]|nr:DegT/DnrJ/EryC1/StrS family aminotransferase [Candidatus Brocadiia bacterium]